MRLTLKEIFLKEQPVSIDEAANKNLALYITTSSVGKKNFVLYDKQKLLELVKEMDKYRVGDEKKLPLKTRPSNLFNKIVKTIVDFDIIIGKIAIANQVHGDAYGTKVIHSVASQKGYGPLLYDIALTDSGLTPDRFHVSGPAQKIWQHYFNKRNDVEKKPLDNKFDPKTEDTFDDSKLHDLNDKSPLDYAYFLKTKVDVQKLISNHSSFLNDFNVYFDKSNPEQNEKFACEMILDAGIKFFQKKYDQL